MSIIICFECGRESPSGSNYCHFCHRHLRHWWPIEQLETSTIPPSSSERSELLNVQFWPITKLTEKDRLANRQLIDAIRQLCADWLMNRPDYDVDIGGHHFGIILPHAAYVDAQAIIDVYSTAGDPRKIRGMSRQASYAVFPATILNLRGHSADLVYSKERMRLKLYTNQKNIKQPNYEVPSTELRRLLSTLQLHADSMATIRKGAP